jgi:xanthosine utilization system XapX-like protein
MSRAATGYTTAAISNAPAILAKIVGILGVGIGEFLCAAANSAPKCAQVTAI